MSRSTFIAARNSRHRTAALALYRALLRTASRIPVAQDVAQKPITQIVRRRFEKNAGYTSFRLVYAAMAAGYKFLNLLTKAQTPNSSEHTQIMQHLQSVRDTAAASRAIPHPQRYKPVLPPEPLLINTAKPYAPPKYTSNILPRPKDLLAGPRKVPSVSATADGQPFVRLKKPQPHVMSRMIGRKNRIFESRILNILDVDERVVPEAALEDDWDRMMDELLAEERSKGGRKQQDTNQSVGAEGNSKMETYSWSVQLSRLWWELKIEKTWEDWIARGEALHHLVEQERTLAEQEQGGRSDAARRSNRRAAASSRRNALDYDDSPPNVGVSPVPSLPLLEAIRSSVPRDEELAEGEASQDPFLSPAWAALVKSQEGRMLKWAGKRVVGQRGD
ncbi:uncharacterized protein TRIVIDRAFT_175684 [Trichoderma virens Gv29-8]|uniref:Complex 1 LYR protein domain-containing protein n=1 Tax=Hypocrea virens (strain Gv29-8 / FGSC 10586) TaxID=413071 RepID=G9MEU6_HYPVG|nr:uncharacterized protein TRIVIDRAFT_175684 [Trichoderma virens Gv29-8]EHK26914.1 hypothetical protein TRIVIDRAFT_175684 [Trichoderma virens Gv29-8]